MNMQRKRIIFILLILLTITLYGCQPEQTDIVGTQVNIFAFNDTHGAFNTDSNYTGIDKVDGVIASLEGANGEYIKVANGDIFQGSYVSNKHHGLPLIEALNEMEIDAFVIGNHEFDWGIEEIALYKDGNEANGEADFDFLAANIVYKETNKNLSWTKDYVVVENNGYKVGIIGVIGEGLESSIASDKVAAYRFLNPVPLVEELSEELRQEKKVDAVVVSIHGYDEYTNEKLAELDGNSRVDAIICGHTHQKIETYEMRSDGYKVPIIQSDDKNDTVGEVILTMENKKAVTGSIKHYDPSKYTATTRMKNIIDKYAATINEGETVVGYTPESLSRNRIGSEITLAMTEQYGCDVAVVNTGGVRNEISTGNIKVKNVFDVFPFDNIIIVTTIKGDKLKAMYEEQGSYLYFNDFNFYNIDEFKTYSLVTIDYVFTSNYYTKYFSNSTPEYKDVYIRDVFITYLQD